MLPLIGALLGLGAGGMFAKMGTDYMEDIKDQRIQKFGDSFNKMKEGLDTTTEEGMRELQLRMMAHPMMQQTGSGMLNSALDRAQQQSQFDYGFNNISAAQQAGFDMQQQELEALNAYRGQQLAQGWAGLRLQRDESNARMNASPWNSVNLQGQQDKLAADMGAATKSYRDALPLYSQTSQLLGRAGENPTQAVASLIGLAKILDPTSVVREGEREVLSDTGLFGSMAKTINAAKGKGLTADQIAATQGALDDIIRAQAGQANARIQAFRGAAEPVMGTGRPALDYDAAVRAQGLYFDPIERRMAESGQKAAATTAVRDDAWKNRPAPSLGPGSRRK